MDAYIQGLVLQASLILALGAQNLFVLDCGIRKRNPVAVALVCSVLDLALILMGVLGAAALFRMVPAFKPLLGVAGVGFLIYYGAIKVREGSKASGMETADVAATNGLRATMIAALSFTLLNPHVYLDTFVLIGGYSSKFPSVTDRLLFGAGTGTVSVLWFFALTLGAGAVSTQLRSPRVYQAVSLVSGLVLIALGVKLGFETREWIGSLVA